MSKKILPIIVILLIIIVLVILSQPKGESVVVTQGGEEVQAGIVDERDVTVSPSNNEDETLRQAQGDTSGAEVSVGIEVGNRAPNFVLESFDGEIVELASIDKPVVVDFWAGWCPFCVAELPELQAVSQEVGDKVQFLGIHRTETESVERGAEFATDKGVTYPLLKDSSGDVYGVYSGGQPFMPVAYFIDENGIIKERVLGPKTEEKIKASVEKLLPAK